MNLDEVAHNKPPNLDLRCLHIQIFSSLVLLTRLKGFRDVFQGYGDVFVNLSL